MSLVVFCCNFSTLQQKPHDYICSGCKNMLSQKCMVFIGPPCTSAGQIKQWIKKSGCTQIWRKLNQLPKEEDLWLGRVQRIDEHHIPEQAQIQPCLMKLLKTVAFCQLCLYNKDWIGLIGLEFYLKSFYDCHLWLML